MNSKHYWGIAALIVFVIAAGGFIYYQWSELQHFKKQAAQEAKQLEGNDKPEAKTFSPGEIGEKRAEADKTNRVVFHADELPKKERRRITKASENPQTGIPETRKQEESTQSDTKVSPYGFGPYPEIPAECPYPIEWNFPGSDADHELMQRVALKLWTQGIETMGATVEDGLVYPNYIDTVYIRWGETTDDDDNPIQYIIDLGGYPPACLRIVENNMARLGERGPMTAADIPSDVTVKLYDEAGIDPHTFLGLPK